MLSTRRHMTIAGLLGLAFLTLFVFAGCGDDGTTASPALNVDTVELSADPLDGALDSTLGSTPERASDRIDRIAEILGLDEEQTEALREAYIAFREGIAALRDQVKTGDLTIAEAKEQAAELRDVFEAALQVILTEEQYDQLQEMRQNREQNRNDQHKGCGDPQACWDTWLVEIGADDGQVAAVMEALATFRSGIQDLRDQVKDGDITREEARDDAKVLREDFDAALQTILTPEQYEALQELRPDCRGKNR